jgi:hypothetical protein
MFSNREKPDFMRFSELSLSAQTAYAELAEQARAFELDARLQGLTGSFHKQVRKGKPYWYFGYRDIGGTLRMLYVGPDDERVRALVDRFSSTRRPRALAPQAAAAIALGCTAAVPKHFRVIKRLGEYGFFQAGGVLIGTHAFIAFGNVLGVRWSDGASTLDMDFAHAGRNVSLALPANLRVDVHDALTSLEMGLLPIAQFSGRSGAQYRNPKDQELRLDFVTSATRDGKPVVMKDLNLALDPLKFMEFSLEGTVQGCLLGREGACTVNLPAPERYAVHKLIIHGERPVSERAKARKDLLQAAGLADWFARAGRTAEFNAAWRDALSRGRGWRSRALAGKKALLDVAPDVDIPALWREPRSVRRAHAR